MQNYYSHGKLLITSEYAVLDGAKAFALPTKFGQHLEVRKSNKKNINWKSFNYQNNLWFETNFSIPNFKPSVANPIAQRLSKCFQVINELQPNLFKGQKGLEFKSHLEFPLNWGLGSSSTLINNLAQWAKVDAYKLLAATFGGSGYDIACAQNPYPITFQKNLKSPKVEKVLFNPPFKEQLFFIYRNHKQDTRKAIANYKVSKHFKKLDFKSMNELTENLIITDKLQDFESIITKHELLISTLIQQTPLKNTHFPDYKGAIKSLGAWGGDFFLATGTDPSYFKNKGYEIIISYKDMIL